MKSSKYVYTKTRYVSQQVTQKISNYGLNIIINVLCCFTGSDIVWNQENIGTGYYREDDLSVIYNELISRMSLPHS